MKKSIKKKLIKCYALLLTTILALHFIASITLFSRNYLTEKRLAAERDINEIRNNIDLYIKTAEKQILSIKYSLSSMYRNKHPHESTNDILFEYANSFPFIELVSNNGTELIKIVRKKEISEKKNIKNSRIYKSAKAKLGKVIHLNDIEYCTSLRTYVLRFALAFTDDKGRFKGVIICSTPLRWIIQEKTPSDAKVRIVSENGVIEFSTIPSEIGKKIEIKHSKSIFAFISVKHNGLESVSVNGENEFIYKKPIFNHSTIILGYSTSNLLEGILSYTMTATGILIIIAIIGTTVIIKISNRITSPIEEITNYIQNFTMLPEKGHLKIKTGDELEILADSINKTRDKLFDLTERLRRKTREAIASNRAKTEFFANITHEIKTPLNAIIGFITILKETESNTQRLEYINIIEKSARDLLRILNDILDFSKIEHGKMQIESKPFNLRDEINQIINTFKAKAKEKNISITLEETNLNQTVTGDALRLKQIIANLLSNAIKFSNEGTTITIKTHYQDEEFCFSIKDEGIGIPEDKQKIILKPFVQADSSATKQFDGTGLGLAISSKLIELMGGKLNLESKENEGSTFFFCLPLKLHQETKNEENLNHNRKSILIVDDNKSNRMLLNIILKKIGCKTDEAQNGKEAIEKFKENEYSIILMDENMPEINGLKATKIIREIEKERHLKHTPIIVITANAVKNEREKFIKAGADEYITKPIDKNKLLNTLKRFI